MQINSVELYTLSRIADLTTTYLVIGKYGGNQVEGNPITRYLLNTIGFSGLTILNLLSVFLIMFFVRRYKKIDLITNIISFVIGLFFLTSLFNLGVYLFL